MTTIQALTLFAVMVSLAAIPSSSVALVVARSATLGTANGIAVAAGIVMADLLFVLLAVLGLSALAETMGGLFSVVKVVGGLYLIWLGISLLKSSGYSMENKAQSQRGKGLAVSFVAGFVLTLGDIKAIIFYASLFPFYIDLASASATDYALIVAITVLGVGSVKVVYAVFASRLTMYAQRTKIGTVPQKLAGGMLVGVGSYVALKA